VQTSSLATPWQLPAYRIRRKVLKIFGASFHVYDGDRVVGFCKQKAFKLREDVRVFADEGQQHELMWIRARQVLDFAAFYDVVDTATQQKLGALRRRGFKSLLRDSWEVLDDTDRPLARVEEDSAALALVRRFLTNLVPQTFTLRGDGGGAATFRQRFNPFVYSLEIAVPADLSIDARLVFAAAVMLAVVEGRQN
jgi:hypothetical protein